jgi:ABC-type multidrug transport system permease subunit
MGIIVFIIWNYTVLGIQTSERQGLILLYIIQFFLWAGTVAQMVISALPSSEVAGMLCIVMFVLSLVFSGVLQSPSNMPHFWKFLWRVSPLSHWIAGIASTGLHGRSVICAAEELSTFNPPASSTCQEYLNQFLNNDHGLGYLLNPDAVINCQYCPFKEADQILAQSGIYWSNRWSNLGYGMIYIGFNVVMTVFLYYVFRIGKMKRSAASLGQKPLDK